MYQRIASTSPANPWWAIVSNRGPGGTISEKLDEDSVIVTLHPEPDTHDVIVTNIPPPTHPVVYGGVDAAISTFGDRAFIGFYHSNNIGMLESTTIPADNKTVAATAARSGCPPDCAGPSIKRLVYTPFNDKVIATIGWTIAADTKIMILDSSAVDADTTIPSSAYTFVQHSSINGAEAIGVWPHFDRDGDDIGEG
jgi:hypothetical protein